MDTAERSSVVPADQVYDGFISYSHAADDLLAPRLQSALQRFAKPWWKRRAVRIFRDESSLSANPHLWSSITEALDTSGWFVLLLSPDAALSEWVNQEIAYWVEHRDAKRILPVVTDGEFGWNGDVTGSAAPEALRGVFSEEPRWVDIRFARDEDQLDLQDPRFADAVADIASTIRGVPKDELASEEVRQHRRTVRTAWAAGAALVVLTVAAVSSAVFALGQRAEAERQAELALANEQRAVEGEAAALVEAAAAEARRLEAVASTVLEEDAQLAMLLLLQAVEVAPEGNVREDTVEALRNAATRNRLLHRFELPPGESFAALSPDAWTIYAAVGADNAFQAIDVETRNVIWEYDDLATGEQADGIYASPTGDTVALGITNPPGVEGRMLVVVDAEDGSVIATLQSEGCRSAGNWGMDYSPDGRFFTLYNGTADCENESGTGGDPEAGWVDVYDTSSWQRVLRHSVEGARNEVLRFSGDSSRALIWYGLGRVVGSQVVTFPDLELRADVGPQRFGTLSPSGFTVVYDVDSGGGNWEALPRLFDVASETVTPVDLGGSLEVSSSLDDALLFSPDGSLLAIIGRGRDAIVDPSDGSIELRLYGAGSTYESWWSADGTKLLTSHDDEVLLWAIVQDPGRLREVLESGDWIGFAQDQLVRGFTAGECLLYDIDPCASLEEMRSR